MRDNAFYRRYEITKFGGKIGKPRPNWKLPIGQRKEAARFERRIKCTL